MSAPQKRVSSVANNPDEEPDDGYQETCCEEGRSGQESCCQEGCCSGEEGCCEEGCCSGQEARSEESCCSGEEGRCQEACCKEEARCSVGAAAGHSGCLRTRAPGSPVRRRYPPPSRQNICPGVSCTPGFLLAPRSKPSVCGRAIAQCSAQEPVHPLRSSVHTSRQRKKTWRSDLRLGTVRGDPSTSGTCAPSASSRCA